MASILTEKAITALMAPVQESGVINVIQLDTDTNKFYHVTETGRRLILPYDADN